MVDIFQWAGCIFWLTGTFLLARHNRFSEKGFYLFLLSNRAWINVAMLNLAQTLLLQNMGFTLTSLLKFTAGEKCVEQAMQIAAR